MSKSGSGCILNWSQKDGTWIMVEDMTTHHVMNCLRRFVRDGTPTNRIKDSMPVRVWVDVLMEELHHRGRLKSDLKEYVKT